MIILEYTQIKTTRWIMRNKKNKHLGIEVEPDLHYKLHYIAKYEGRSGNGQILHLIRQFEQENGPIDVPHPEAPN